MQKEQLYIKNKAFSLIEILISVSLFLLFVTMLADVSFNSKRQIKNAVNREKAVAMAEEGLEAVRNIRDNNFLNLTNGTFGLATTSSRWTLSGLSDSNGIFTRKITISTINTSQKKVDVDVVWSDQSTSSSTIKLSSYFTDWRQSCNQANSFTINTAGATLTNTNRRLNIPLGSVDCNAIIDTITISWTTTSRRLTQVVINGVTVATVSLATPAIVNIANTTITAGSTNVPSYFTFNGSVLGNTFNITYTMLDGTTKTVNFTK